MRSANIRIWSSLLFAFLLGSSLFAQRGKDGAKVISVANTIVNEYTLLSADASSGSSFVSVASSNLNTSGLFSSSLSAGDLIMIIQMQGATIKMASDTSYGEVLNYNNCGNYEFCEIASVPDATTINFDCPLQHDYSVSGKVQVIRVPRYSSLTINNGFGITCSNWNGSTGGVVTMEVLGNTVLNGTGKIDVTGKGFRGGILNENLSAYGVNNTYSAIGDLGAEKGEGIAGFETAYDLLGGRYCRGAAANAGGGGNAHNSGGGGGANAGDPVIYTGKGCPDVSNASWVTAWNLEYNGFASLISSGGGRGGYTFSSSNQNALVTGPNNVAWGGDKRDYNGGLGGRPLDYSAGKIFIGGGGGAGDQNDNRGGNGGNGGGMIYLLNSGTVSGIGQLIATGGNGSNTSSSSGNDAAGGGGGGGTVIINSAGMISGISASASGGNGGNQILSLLNQEAEGPGAGGGGGYIAVSNGIISRTAAGGNNGTTNSFSLTEFPPNGATKGGSGTTNAVIPEFHLVTNDDTICSGSTATLNVSVSGTAPAGITFQWYNTSSGGTLLGTGNTFTSPVLTSSATYFVGSCPGTYRQAIRVNVDVVQPNFSFTTTCLGTATTFSGTATTSLGFALTWNWGFGDGTGSASLQNPVYSYTAAASYNVILTVHDNLGCTKSVTRNVSVNPRPLIMFSSDVTNGCGQVNAVFSNTTTNGNVYFWNFGDGNNSAQLTPSHSYNAPGQYTVSLSAVSVNNCSSTDSIVDMITVNPAPIAIFSATNACLGDTIHFLNSSVGNGSVISNFNWNFGDGSGTSSDQNPFYVYASQGNYDLVLIVTNAAGCSDTSVQTIVVSPAPVVNFASDLFNGCGQASINFTNNTSGIAVFNWSFGDGDTSTQITPSHTYIAPGLYTVILSALNGSCRDADTIVNMISVYPKPTASFNVTSVCEKDSTRFINASMGNGEMITNYSWDFGDSLYSSLSNPSHHYVSVGSHIATLIVADSSGCRDTISQPVSIYPVPDVNFTTNSQSACDSLVVNFSNNTSGASTYLWHFGDGGTSTNINPTYHYSVPGTYTVALTATTSHGCDLSLAVLNMIIIHPSPVVDFSASQTNFCSNNCIGFSDLSNGVHSMWSWSFPGAIPVSSAIQNPSTVCYSAPGIYAVTLTTSNNFCSSEKTISNYINVLNCSQPVADFFSSDTTICSGTCLNFVNTSSNVNALRWLFPGAVPSVSTDMNPANICYGVPGNYDVTLIASNPLTADTLFIPGYIHVFAPPSAPVIFQQADTLMIAPTASSYQWYYDSISISGTNNPYYTAVLPGHYSVLITDFAGCTATSSSYYFSLVGVTTINQQNGLVIYPNPVSGLLNIRFDSKERDQMKIKIETIQGVLLAEKRFNVVNGTNHFSLDVGSLSSGIYFISLETSAGVLIQKFIRQ